MNLALGLTLYGRRTTVGGAVSITGTLATMTIGQAYDSSLTVTPAGSAVTIDATFATFIAAHSIAHDGYGRFTSASVT